MLFKIEIEILSLIEKMWFAVRLTLQIFMNLHNVSYLLSIQTQIISRLHGKKVKSCYRIKCVKILNLTT